jgi:P4 family phage/plasmid primase-like protien
MATLQQFLDMRRVEKGADKNKDENVEITHTSMGTPKGSFMIKKSEMNKFFELYDQAYQNGDDLHIIERHIDYGPVVIDLDFEYAPDVVERQHDEKHIMGIVKLYMDEIVNMFQIESDDNRLMAFVFEKPELYREKEKNSGDEENGATTGGSKYKKTKDGIHIMFPYIVSTPEPQYIIRENIMKKIGSVLDEIPLNVPISKEGAKSYSSVIDRSVIQSNGWFLYGSTKPKRPKYAITYVIKNDGSVITEDDIENISSEDMLTLFNGMNPTRFFSIRNKNESDILAIRDENLDAIGKFRSSEQKKVNKKKMNGKMDENELKLIKQFVQIFSDKRANEYNSWIEVGWALHNIGSENQDLLDVWIEFSKRSPKYTEGECETLWESMKNEGLGIGSIRYWARLDNPDMYKKIILNDINKMINASIKTPTTYDIAAVLHRMYRYDYKYSQTGVWYYFDNNLWRQNNDGIMLRNKISNDLCEKYVQIVYENNQEMLNNPELTDEDKEDIKARNKEILGIIMKLKTTSFKDNIVKECKELFYDIEFLNELDENWYLIGFNNGVYDLKRGEFREGRPDDYITLSTRVDKIEFSEDHEQWPELSKFIYTIFPNEEKREYFMTFLSTCLQGLNAEEKFRVWTGSGSNGKSKLEELFTAGFGDYTIKFPITLLTGKRAASNACSPELVKAKGKRIGYFVEPSEGERVNAGLMKEFTGGDKIYARGLNQDPIEFKPQFKLSLLCNDVPHFPPKDTGVWRRVEIVEFTSKFTDNPNPENPNEFPIDSKITEKIKDWKELFMAYLIDVYYKRYRETGGKSLVVPEEVKKFTEEMKLMFDMYSGFIVNVIVETKVPEDVVTLSELYEEFKNWFLEIYNSPKIPTKHEFRQYMEKTFGKQNVTTTEVKGIKSKMKIEEEKKKKEAEERAKRIENGEILEDDLIEEDNESDDEIGLVPLSQSELDALNEEDIDFDTESIDEVIDTEEFNKKYRNPDGSMKTPPKLKSFGTTVGMPSFKGMNDGKENTQVTTKNNEYNITSMEQLKSLKLPGMDNIDENPVLKAIFSRDMNQIRDLQYLDMKEIGLHTYALPTKEIPPVKTVETFEDENGNRTTTTTITTTKNIPTVKFEGLPPGFKGNPFALIASRRPPPPPPHHIAAALLASVLARREMEEEERERRRALGLPEPEPEPEPEINDEDIDIPPDHPVLIAFASLMRNMIQHDIEENMKNNPNVSHEEAEKILKRIQEDEEEERRRVEEYRKMRFEAMARAQMEDEAEADRIEAEAEEMINKKNEEDVKIEDLDNVVQEKKSVKRGRKPKNNA